LIYTICVPIRAFPLTLGLASLCLLAAGIVAQGPPSRKVDFNRDVRAILSKCAACHGPAAEAGMAGLRLDSFAAATAKLPSGNRAIVPGRPDESALIFRINTPEKGLMMPPPESHKTLTAEERAILREWIAQGAVYKEHWAFVAPVRPALPSVRDKRWATSGIDRFVLAGLERNGLAPEPEAARETLLRRVSLDITGLPPTPEEVDEFLTDKSHNAYEKVVDRLLASPRYGERMAMDWMDYSRYADSNGYQADYERFQSRWRDWVIEAFNANMPYDQFTVEQIAGDLLPNATPSQKLATAFNRNHRINTEGGVIAEEWRVENVVDRVETTSAVWLGLTTGCARCHDHKYDPISQKDFYRLFAYFNNVPESGTGEERPVSHPPGMKAPSRDQAEGLGILEAQMRAAAQGMAAMLPGGIEKSADWKPDAALPQVAPAPAARFAFKPGSVKVVGDPAFEAGRATGALRASNQVYADLGDVGDFERGQPFSFGGWIHSDNGNGSPFSRMESANAYRGWEASIFNGRPQAHLIHKWPENAIKIAAKDPIPVRRWVHLFVTYDGSSRASGMKMYLDGKLVPANVENDSLKDTIRTKVTAKAGRRTDSEFFNGMVDDFAIFDRALGADEVAKLASTHPALPLAAIEKGKRTKAEREALARLWLLERSASYRDLDARHTDAVRAKGELDAQIPQVMVMEEMPKPREAFVLLRGQYDKRGEKVEAGVPGFLPELPNSGPNNRLALAKWIVSPKNPLTSRVTVNRLWERFFGTGLVSTLEDFGTRAEFPSNPELLDYLATELLRLKWDLKAMIKQIVMSAAYRQSSFTSEEKLQKDPQNRLVSRGPRYRLPGEVIRDQALFAAGLLVEKLGGPSVYPYMPEGVWDETNFYGNLRNYRHSPSGLYRRSLYTIWKRTAAPPNMLTFDVPSRESCRVQRARTDTPLQALTLMNDVTFVEAARVLAQRAFREAGPDAASRLGYAFKCVLSRSPTSTELAILLAGYEKRLEHYRRSPEAASKLLEVGVYRVDKEVEPAALAALAVSASTILNLDEAVNKE
jgi:hypothetical protein